MQRARRLSVVYLLTPTSNHNRRLHLKFSRRLYIFWLLHQTTTNKPTCRNSYELYIFWLLHQTTTSLTSSSSLLLLYIFWLLHQTTTRGGQSVFYPRCISFDSYIKPQLAPITLLPVIRCISFDSYIKPQPVSIFRILNWCCISFDSYIKPQRWAATTLCKPSCISFDSYIKPQRGANWTLWTSGCISFDSYIKPQQDGRTYLCCRVVYLLTPTSNHNYWHATELSFWLYIFWLLHQTTTVKTLYRAIDSCISFDSYIKPQPSTLLALNGSVVYLLTPTSNHNVNGTSTDITSLYIFWLLHQTTTKTPRASNASSCISFDSYIKPQQILTSLLHGIVVYLLTPTSNHNEGARWWLDDTLYIFWLLHQTTTVRAAAPAGWQLYIFWLLHQTTTDRLAVLKKQGCISFDSYIKPQLFLGGFLQQLVVYLLTPTSNHNQVW